MILQSSCRKPEYVSEPKIREYVSEPKIQIDVSEPRKYTEYVSEPRKYTEYATKLKMWVQATDSEVQDKSLNLDYNINKLL